MRRGNLANQGDCSRVQALACTPGLLWLRSGPMLRFRLGAIPVEVHLSHLLFSSLLGVLMVLTVRESPAALHLDFWPYNQLVREPGSPEALQAGILVVLAWMLIVFVSALGHEAGHALMLRAFGYRPSISLLWLGGTT